MRKWLLRAAIGVGLIAAPLALWAQTTQVVQNLVGTEILRVASGPTPGGTGFYTSTAAIRNGTALKLFSGLTGTQTYTALTSNSTLYWVGTAPTSWTVTTPAAPFDGEILTLATDTTLTSMVTLTANTGQSLNSSYTNQTLSAKTSVEFQYSTSTTKWYELR